MAPKTAPKYDYREFIIDCIQLYKDLPSLWKVKSKQYHDRHEKNKAYDVLLSKYRQVYPDASKEELKKKLNVLRTNYRKELRKYKQSNKRKPYQPTLWYFKEMSFLDDEDFPADESATIDNITQTVHEEPKHESPTSSEEDEEEVEEIESTYIEIPRKRSKKDERLLNVAYENLSTKKDEFYYWAMACAPDLRKMEKTQQLYAKKAIADVIMQGQLGHLHRKSIKINVEH